MTRHPQISIQRLHAWARRRAIPVRRDGDWLYFTGETFQDCAFRAGITSEHSLLIALTLPLTEEGHDLGLAQASAEEADRILALRAMADGSPRYIFIAPRYTKDPAKIDLVALVYLWQGVTDTQLDQVIPDAVDALCLAGAFHPLLAQAGQRDSTIDEGGAGSPLTSQWRRAIAGSPSAPMRPDMSTETGAAGQWWIADPDRETSLVTGERVLNLVRWFNAEALVERRNDSDVILLRSQDLTFEITVYGDGRMNFSHRRELTHEEMNQPGLKECISQARGKYLHLTIGLMEHPDGGTMRVQYTHHLVRMSEEELDSVITAIFYLVRGFMDSLDEALAAPDQGKGGNSWL
ncbi:MAG: hypothetical protein Q4C87_00385 [Actinomycetaceae bacterium]|nr:hypothetical protein [Actinomycetaceae bacterium]